MENVVDNHHPSDAREEGYVLRYTEGHDAKGG